MNSPEISVILPVYNAAPFIDRTLRNLVEEQFSALQPEEWEIIAVVDASTDASELHIRRWAERYPDNITMHCPAERRGVSAARNLALSQARGRYVYFMDADDLLTANALPRLLHEAGTCGTDILRFAYRPISLDEYQAFGSAAPPLPTDITFRTTSASEFLDQTRGLLDFAGLWSVWSALFRTEFLRHNNLQFIEGLHVGEDCMLQWQAMLCRPCMLVSDAPLYLYLTNPHGCINAVDRAHLQRKAAAMGRLAELEEAFISENRDRVSTRTLSGWNESLTYALRDRLACLIALEAPTATIAGVLKKFLALGGRISPREHPFHLAGANLSAGAKTTAWLLTRICSISKKFRRKQ